VKRILNLIAKRNPQIDRMLKQARMNEKPEVFLKKTLTVSLYIALTFAFLLFMFFDKMEISLALLLIIVPVIYLMFFSFFIQSPKVKIRKREREINQEILFAGRYLLIKLDSGIPLYNALMDASRSYGISSKYFKEIVDDIRIGTPIEDALEFTREASPSKFFKLILTELITSLKTGVDVSIALREVLQQITKEQIIEIKEYSKKLNAFMMMYMVIATVMPSLGVTMFIIIAGFMGLDISTTIIFIILGMMSFVQFIFISVLKSIRPMVNL